MAYDAIRVLRFVFIITGAVPGDWQENWKQTAFRVYAYTMDLQYLLLVIAKVSHTVRLAKFKQDLYDDYWETLITISVVMERILIRWKKEEILQLFGKIYEFPKPGLHVIDLVQIYKKQAQKVVLVFSVFTITSVLELTLNYLMKPCSLYETQDEHRVCKSFVYEVDLPSSLLMPPWYDILFICNVIQTAFLALLGLISFIMIPLMIIEVSLQFRIIADAFKKRLKVGVYKLRSDERCTNGEQDLVDVVKHHQYTLEVSSMMINMFHTIVLLKIVSMTLPIIIGAYSLSQFPFGSFDFFRFTALFFTLLIQLATFCYFGEQLTGHSLMVYRAVYMNEWYLMDKDGKRMLLFVATRAIRPARLEVWAHFVPVSLETFLNICQFSYSVYSLLMVTSGKPQ